MSSSQHRYLPLDGLRGIAIAGVFWFHYRIVPHSPGEWGWVGVDLFFALSGYLITGILYDSRQHPGYFKNFYMRRALRIFPLYWGLWILFILAMVIARGRFDPYFLAWPAYLGNYVDLHALGVGLKHNFYTVLPLTIHFAGEKFKLRIGPYWSLCVEEQYYLVWPLVLRCIRDRGKLIRFCLIGMAAILAARIVLHFTLPAVWIRDDEIYFFSPTRADTLLAGSALALWARGERGIEGIRLPWIFTVAGLAVAGLVLSTWRWGLFHKATFAPWMQTYGFTLVAVAAAGALTAALRVPWVARPLSWKPLVSLGAVSYGFYVFHLLFYDCDRIPIDATRGIVPAWVFHCAIFAFVWALSWFSFRFYEQPFLRLKQRFGGSEDQKLPEPPKQAEMQ
ncbi:MAG: acyltransferase family protein [Acidobacteriota bacterium]